MILKIEVCFLCFFVSLCAFFTFSTFDFYFELEREKMKEIYGL